MEFRFNWHGTGHGTAIFTDIWFFGLIEALKEFVMRDWCFENVMLKPSQFKKNGVVWLENRFQRQTQEDFYPLQNVKEYHHWMMWNL